MSNIFFVTPSSIPLHEAIRHVIVHDANRLRVRIHDGGADELEAALLEPLADAPIHVDYHDNE